MKKILFILAFFISYSCFSQEEKETVYLLFDATSKEKYKVEVEGKGYLNLNKYRKESGGGDFVFYYIGDERFSAHKTKSYKDTSSVSAMEDLNIVSLAYIQKEKAKAKTIFGYNPFKKIYIIEKISKDKIVKIEVVLIDDLIMVD